MNIVRNLVLLQNELRFFTFCSKNMLDCLKHFEILKEGSNSIASNHLLICVTLCFDIYDHLYAYHKQASSMVQCNTRGARNLQRMYQLNYPKHLTPKSDHLIIQDIKTIIQNSKFLCSAYYFSIRIKPIFKIGIDKQC